MYAQYMPPSLREVAKRSFDEGSKKDTNFFVLLQSRFTRQLPPKGSLFRITPFICAF